MLGTMLASGRATLLRYDPNGKPPWRPLTEGSPTDGTPALLQLYELQGAQFSFVAKYLHTNTELLRLNLNNVKYNIQSETKHDITIDDGSIYSVKFLDAKEGNMFTTIVNNTIHEIKRAGADISRGRGRSIPLPGMVGLPNVQSPKEAWLPASGGQGAYRRPPPPPRPSNSTNGRQSDPQLDITFDNFKKAVASGDVRAATDFAKVLAEKRYNGSVDATTLPRPASYKDQMINIKVHIEDKVSSGGVVVLLVKPSTTIAALKKQMLEKYNFPLQVQNWIIGKRLGKDEETLASFGIKNTGANVYMYLVSAASVGLTREQFEGQRQNLEQLPSPIPFNDGQGAAAVNPYNMSNLRIENNIIDLTSPNIAVPPATGATASNVIGNSPQRPLLPPPPAQRQGSVSRDGWTCPICTFVNPPTRPGCEMCSADRPEDFQIPDDYVPMGPEKDRLQEVALHEQLFAQAQQFDKERTKQLREINFQNILAIEEQDLIPNVEEFDCPICFVPIEIGEGVILRNCLHTFCRDCLGGHINFNEEAAVMCPYQDDVHSCQFPLTEREIKALVTPQQFQKYLERGLHTAENQATDSYHCKTPDCAGWCYYEDDNNKFHCPVCRQANCLTCKAIHQGMNCKEYQDDLKRRANNDVAAKQTQEMLQKLIADGDALNCPRCHIVLQKKEGCDWLRCTMCKLEICWVTKGPRWGPMGQGDISGGCRCRVNNQKCHPNCRNCH